MKTFKRYLSAVFYAVGLVFLIPSLIFFVIGATVNGELDIFTSKANKMREALINNEA